MHPLHQNNMNDYGDDTDSSSCCYFHPKQVVIGVCPLCLNERLLILASKQGHSSSSSSSAHRSKVASDNKKQPGISNIPKIFALGSLLNRFEFRHWKSDISDQRDACTSSQEDSFISIKFEDNGVASWEKGTVSKVSLDHCSMSWNNINNSSSNNNDNDNDNSTVAKQPIEKEINKSVIEHAKQRGATLRWRKRIGHLLQLVRWKARSSNRGNVDGGVKVRKGWMRTLTKRGTGPKNKGIVV
ncbi:hypothetical protein AB3S75_014341 [Citrus x aurantiifolia]